MDSEGGFKFEDTPQQTAEEQFKAAMEALAVFTSAGFIDIDQAQLMKEMIRELLHWGYAKAGTHGTPAQVFRAVIANAKRDAGVVDPFQHSAVKSGKTND